jgi:hypothetical protein
MVIILELKLEKILLNFFTRWRFWSKHHYWGTNEKLGLLLHKPCICECILIQFGCPLILVFDQWVHFIKDTIAYLVDHLL